MSPGLVSVGEPDRISKDAAYWPDCKSADAKVHVSDRPGRFAGSNKCGHYEGFPAIYCSGPDDVSALKQLVTLDIQRSENAGFRRWRDDLMMDFGSG